MMAYVEQAMVTSSLPTKSVSIKKQPLKLPVMTPVLAPARKVLYGSNGSGGKLVVPPAVKKQSSIITEKAKLLSAPPPDKLQSENGKNDKVQNIVEPITAKRPMIQPKPAKSTGDYIMSSK